ncbi:MAG: hypothetical protein QM758_15135 [Armatimonas sp.]
MEKDHTAAIEWTLAFRRDTAEENATSWLPDAPLSSEEVLYRILTTVGHPWNPSRTVDIHHGTLRTDLESSLGIDGGLLAPDEPWSSLKSPATLEDLTITLEAAYLACWRNAQEFGLQKEAADYCWRWVAHCAAELGATSIRPETRISSALTAEAAEILSFSLDWYAPDGQGRLARFQTPAVIYHLKLLVGLGGSVWCFLLAAYSIAPVWLAMAIWVVGGLMLYVTDRSMRQHEWSEPETTFGALAENIHRRARIAGETMRNAMLNENTPKANPLTLLD